MKTAYLLAYPAGHSLSPAMHAAAFAALGLPGRYEAWEVAPGGLPDAVAALRAPDVYGANVTIPHKEAALPLLDALTDEARAIGAVNTVVQRKGRLTGHNTDAAGFLRGLREDAGLEPERKRAVVLGAGGAARAVAYALLTAGAGSVQLHNRTRARATALANALTPFGPITPVAEPDLPGAVRGCDLLVNTTAVGMSTAGGSDASPLPPGLLPERGFVCDIIYRPARTKLLQDAAAAGLPWQNGLPMLVYQGAEAFSLWTGVPAPIAAMRQAALSALA